MCSDTDTHTHYDFYCLHRKVPVEQIKLLPGETDDVQWATFSQIHAMIRRRQICYIIANQFIRQEPYLKTKQIVQK